VRKSFTRLREEFLFIDENTRAIVLLRALDVQRDMRLTAPCTDVLTRHHDLARLRAGVEHD
jgi:hypothetical protein